MKRMMLVICALAGFYAVALVSAPPAYSTQKAVNKCGKTMAKEIAKMLRLYEKFFSKCYSARHKCALEDTMSAKQDCLDATRVSGKPCSCEKLDIDNSAPGTIGAALLKSEDKIAKKCDPAQEPDLSLEELLYEDPGDSRRQLGFADRRNCMCGLLVGTGNGTIDNFPETRQCIRIRAVTRAGGTTASRGEVGRTDQCRDHLGRHKPHDQ